MPCAGFVSFRTFCIILFVSKIVNPSQVTESDLFSNSREPRTGMKELNMQNLPSCLSMVMCRMEGMDKNSPDSVTTKNQNLLEMLLKNLMNGNSDKSGEGSSEEANEPHDDGDNSSPQSLDYDDNYNEIYQSRSGFANPWKKSEKGSGRMFGISYPMPKHYKTQTQTMDNILRTQSHKDLHDIKTALQLKKGRSSSQCSPRKSRLLRLTWIRNRYPITSTLSPVAAPASASTTPQMSCPYDFAELQSMLFGAFNNILMTGGGLAGAALMQQPPKQEMPMPMMQSGAAASAGGGGLGLENLMTMINKDGKVPYTVYANFKLPLTISTDGTEMQDKVAKLHSQQYSQMFGADSKIPGVGAVAQKVKYSDFFRRLGISAKLRKTPIKEIEDKFSSPAVNANSMESDESNEVSQEKEEWVKIKTQNLLKMETPQKPKPALTRISLDFHQYLRAMQNTFAQLHNNFFARFQRQGYKTFAKRRLPPQSVHHYRIKNGNAEWHRFPKIYLTSAENFKPEEESSER